MWSKKIATLGLAALCSCSLVTVPASANTIEAETYSISVGINPAYEIADTCTSNLSISGTTAYCTSRTDGENVVHITVKQTLQKYSGWFWIWNDVDGAEWTKSANSSTISLSNSKSGLSKGTYRTKSVFTLTNSSGKTETLTVYSVEKRVS